MDFPLPLPPRCRESWKRKRAVGAMSRRRLWLCSRLIVARALSATGEAITLVGLAEAAGGGEGGEALVEGGGADAAARAQLGERQRAVDIGECGSDALVDGTGSRRLRGSRFDDLERESVGALSEFECHAGHGRSGAVLDGQGDIAVFAGIAVAAEVEVGIAPGMELGGASQGLAGADVAGALLGVVDDDDGDGVAALQLAQIGEQRRHFAAGVLIDAMQAHEGIEDEQARVQFGDGRIEASAVGLKIEPHGGCGDDLDVEISEAEAGGGADAVEPPAHDVERVQRSRARKDLQHLGSLPMIPTACSDHSPVTSQRCSSARSARRQAGSTGNRLIAVALLRPWHRQLAGRRMSPASAA